jgi:hypothetical protein
MKLLSIILAVCLIVTATAEAKPKAPKPAKRTAADLTSVELHETAIQELQSVPAAEGAAVQPMATSPGDALVSTAEALKEEVQEPLASSEIEIGAQSYRPLGSGQVAAGETYSYDHLSAKPMLLAGGRHWFYQGLRTSFPFRAGVGLQAGFSRNSMVIQTNRGFVYDDVHLNSIVALVGPEAEYFLDAKRRFGVGLRAAAGRLLSAQSATNTSITQSQSASIWEGSAHFRYQPSSSFFVKLAYARRANLGSGHGIRVQQNNYEAFVGFGM